MIIKRENLTAVMREMIAIETGGKIFGIDEANNIFSVMVDSR